MKAIPKIQTKRLILTWPTTEQIDQYYCDIINTNMFDTIQWDGPESPNEIHEYWEACTKDDPKDTKFSLSFVLDYINPPKDRFENELIKQTAEEALLNHNDYEVPLKMNATTTELNNVINIESLQKKLETTFARKILSLKSCVFNFLL